jgi:antirestriction protein
MDPQLPVHERRLDGTALTGPLTELFAVDLTAARSTCAHCGGTAALSEHHLYRDAPAQVLRCRDCGGVLLRCRADEGQVRADLSGLSLLIGPCRPSAGDAAAIEQRR